MQDEKHVLFALELTAARHNLAQVLGNQDRWIIRELGSIDLKMIEELSKLYKNDMKVKVLTNAGYTMKDISRIAGISASYISKIRASKKYTGLEIKTPVRFDENAIERFNAIKEYLKI
jgi:uncharacterized protein YerC